MQANIKAIFFDVFGTLVDWRTSVAREAMAVLEPLGHRADIAIIMTVERGDIALRTLHIGHVAPRAILAFSGALIAPDTLEAEIANHAPVLLAHGEADGQVPISRSRDAETLLIKLGVPVETAYSAGLGHGIDDHGIAMGALALQRGFA